MTHSFQTIVEDIHGLGFSIRITTGPGGVQLHAICRVTGEEFFSRCKAGDEYQAARDLRELIGVRGRKSHTRRERTTR